MPQLTRLRFVNLGHGGARMEDLTIPLHDETGRAADSVLWLRNGGGKSSLLSLFFALIIPHRSQFLGAKTSQGERRFEHYVREGDCAVVLAEWQLDVSADDLPVRYLTSSFCQWRNEELQRLFFASRVIEPDITFEIVPLKDVAGRKYNLAGFRTAWQNLSVRHPAAEAHETSNQQTWRDTLNQARIDPELFGYQIHMNSQEGGADKLFASFGTTDHFVDFFIKMVASADKNEVIAKNLNDFRQRLRERKTLQAELTLVESLAPKIEPMLGAAARRQAYRKYAGELRSGVEHLQTIIEERQLTTDREIGDTIDLLNAAKISAADADAEAQTHNERMLSLNRLRLERRANRFSDEQKELEKRLEETTHAHLVWKAALPFADVIRGKQNVRALEEDLRSQDVELKPDWDEVRASARRLAAALLARANENRRLAHSKSGEAAKHSAKARQSRRTADETLTRIGAAKNQAKQFAEKIERADAARGKLETAGTLEKNESLQSAFDRWRREFNELGKRENHLTAETEKARRLFDSLAAELEDRRRQSLKAQQTAEEARRTFAAALDEQNDLLGAPILKQIFGEVDREILSAASLDLLRTERAALETAWRELGAAIAENEFVFEYLQTHKLLPPTRDVRVVLKTLEDKGIVAFAGWKYVAEFYREREKARRFIAARPEIALGVLVPDKNFESAKTALLATNLPLDAAVVIFPKSRADEKKNNSVAAQHFVVGPSGDAHFESAAAKDEEINLELRLRRERDEREAFGRREGELRTVINDLQKFIVAYPKGSFERLETEALAAETYHQECSEEIAELERSRVETGDLIIQLKQNLAKISDDKRRAEKRFEQIETHFEQHGTDAQLIEFAEQKTTAETQARSLSAEAERLNEVVETENEQARSLENEAKEFDKNADADWHKSRAVEHLEGEPPPEAGDVDALRDVHTRLCSLIKQKTDANSLRLKLEQEQALLEEATKRFDEARDASILETEIQEMLKNTPDKNAILRRRDAAENLKFDLKESIGAAKSETNNARKELEQHQNQHQRLGIKVEDKEYDLTEDELENRARLAQAATDAARAQAVERGREIAELEKEEMRLQSLRHGFQSWLTRVGNIADDEVFRDAVESAPLATQSPETEIETSLQALEKKVPDARRRRTKLIEERGKIYKTFLDCLENEPFDFAKQLKNWSEEYLESNARRVLDDLETREKNIRADLENAESYRKTIVELLLGAAEQGAKMLRDLANSSKLPDAAGNLAGQPFLKIELQISENRSERSERIGSLIDDIVQEEQMPKGIEIVQRAVRKLPQKPIGVRVLFPDVDAFRTQYRPITAMAGESGGERLTSAVLLYCALMRQRAKERGTNQKISSSLLLDNPFGQVTRRKFLALQRATARAMNIQLIYPTGVDSVEALSIFPNIVRLRNERRNSKGDCLLEAVREMLPDEENSNGGRARKK